MRTLARRHLIGIGATLIVANPLLAAAPAFAATRPQLTLWKQHASGCCGAWAWLFHEAGFAVTMHEVEDVAPARAAAGVPDELAGCHTARVGRYTIEGHVPVAAVLRLLAEQPALIGLAVPGMPVAVPGMQAPAIQPGPLRIIAFAADGARQLFA